jgi:predicted transposase YbfD/YdcC
VLLNEVSLFLTFSLRDVRAGVDVAKVALGLNPTCSAELWNTLGDGQGLRITIGGQGDLGCASLISFRDCHRAKRPSFPNLIQAHRSWSPGMETHPLAIAHFFQGLPDPRRSGACRHHFSDILVIAICAAVSGQFAWTDIEDYGHIHHDWFKTFLRLPNGIPAHDTFRYVFTRLDPAAFQRSFARWIEALSAATDLKHIAIDGKALCGSRDVAHGKAALHLVSAWASHNRLTLGQVAAEEKSNEITAIPELLQLLDLKGALVTIDALGCQKEIAARIREQQGHYVLALKENHPGLLADVRGAVGDHIERMAPEGGSCVETVDRGHGRRERRLYTLVEDLSAVADRESWPDLRAVVTVVSERTVGGETGSEIRYYLTSYPGTVAELAAAIRGHWGIENRCHWVLDVTFGEDGSRQRREHGAENVAWLRRLALSLLANEPTPELNLKQKSRRALCDHDFLLKVLSPVLGPQEDA